jgi:hypothetical protein
MAVQAFFNPEHNGQLYGDMLGLFIVTSVLMWLIPKK